MDATRLAPQIETRTGIPVIDSIACTLWGALKQVEADMQPLTSWGRIFRV